MRGSTRRRWCTGRKRIARSQRPHRVNDAIRQVIEATGVPSWLMNPCFASEAPATPSVVYTADTDPNHLLGRPGGYLSKASFTDTRISSPGLAGCPAGAVELGGSVETYADATGVQNRMNYIQGIAQSNPMFGEYDYTAGPALIRVSRLLTPQQAANYRSAAHQIAAS